MLWWDDNCGKDQKQKGSTFIPSVLDNEEEITKCFRNTGAVPVPRKVSKSYNAPIIRKISAPEIKTAPKEPVKISRKVSCPIPKFEPQKTAVKPSLPPTTKPVVELKLLKASEDALCDIFANNELKDFHSDQISVLTPKQLVQPAGGAATFVKVTQKPKIVTATEKAKTTEAEIRKELKRGSMKEKWGLSLVYRMENSRIELAVNKVSMFSPAAKAGIKQGDTILLINDWKVEAMDQIQAALNIFLAAGFSVNLGWSQISNSCLDDWGSLDVI